MISTLITSQMRIKLLKKFFLNGSTKAHLRGLESEFGDSTNAIRVELNRFEKAGLLTSLHEGNKKIYQANQEHPLFKDIHNIILKETGIDKVIENVIHRIGNLFTVYLTGDFACGRDGKVIDLILVGNDINEEYLNKKVHQAEEMIGREVHYQIFCLAEAKNSLMNYKPADLLPLWSNGRGKIDF
jgi:DeoR/GlpR family transcriptional regulator of sugar metabolism